MNPIRLNFAVLACVSACFAGVPRLHAEDANLVGTVRLKETSPSAAGSLGASISGGGLGGVFVYVKSGTGVDGVRFETPKTKPILDRTRAGFQPYALGVMAGQAFTVRNSDESLDNISFSGARNQGLNFGQPSVGHTKDVVLNVPEVAVTVRTDVHPAHRAHVGVFANPYFAVTDTAGRYSIAGLPPGRYTLVAFHPKNHGRTEGVEKQVEIAANKATTEDFTVATPGK